MMDYPLLVFAVSVVGLWLSANIGYSQRRRSAHMAEPVLEHLGGVLGAGLTLLALIIGFSFSMAVSRYDQRKNYEEAEANAIGTEFARAGLLPPESASKVRELLRAYTDERVLFYTTRSASQLDQINASTARLQDNMWSAVQVAGTAQPTPMMALVVAGMNDVLNSQGYTQAAWWNRIPAAAWALMAAIAIFCTWLLGYNCKPAEHERRWFFLLPVLVSISFFLIADLDSPRRGVIRVSPQNLLSLAGSLRTP